VVTQFKIEDSDDGPFGLRLVPKKDANGRIYKIRALSEDTRVNWMEALRTISAGSNNSNKATIQIEEKLRREQYAIPAQDLEWGTGTADILGKGASGVVKKGRWLKTTDVAIKALNNLPEFTDPREMMSFFKEIEMLRYGRRKRSGDNLYPLFFFPVNYDIQILYRCLAIVERRATYVWLLNLSRAAICGVSFMTRIYLTCPSISKSN
jgi:hypothetical protein